MTKTLKVAIFVNRYELGGRGGWDPGRTWPPSCASSQLPLEDPSSLRSSYWPSQGFPANIGGQLVCKRQWEPKRSIDTPTAPPPPAPAPVAGLITNYARLPKKKPPPLERMIPQRVAAEGTEMILSCRFYICVQPLRPGQRTMSGPSAP
jgi:hypothetical protein